MSNLELFEHRVLMSPAQLRKMKSGGAINLTSSMFHPQAPHSMMLLPQTAKKVASAMRRDKGIRVALKGAEDLVQHTSGGKISLKSIGHSLDRAFKPAVPALKAFGKVAIPVAAGYAGAALGGLAGSYMAPGAGTIVGEQAGQALGTYAGNRAVQGWGVRRRKIGGKANKTINFLKKAGKAVGITKENTKMIAKEAAALASAMAGEAVAQYTGNPEAGAIVAKIADKSANRLIDTEGDTGKALSTGLRTTASEMLPIAQREASAYAGKHLSGEHLTLANNMINSPETAHHTLRSYAQEQMVPAYGSAYGGGIRIGRTKGGMRVGSGSPYISPAYHQAMEGSGFTVADDRYVEPAPSHLTQLGSPYARSNSAQMSPYIPSSPQMPKRIIKSVGGALYRETLGSGTKLLDQKFSINDVKRFGNQNFGKGTPLLDQKFSINDVKKFGNQNKGFFGKKGGSFVPAGGY